MFVDHALHYASRGWPVFRLSASSKLPVKGSHGFRDATTDAAAIEQWWAEKPKSNVGFATGRLIVIDPDGPTALARLAAIGAPHGGWPRTLTAKTPRSIHLYYLAPPGIEIRSFNEPRASKGADGIDIKGTGGYTVLPPSKIKKDGEWFEYSWLLQEQLAILPDWAVEWISSLKGAKEQSGNNLLGSAPLPSYLAQSKQNNQQVQRVTKLAQRGLAPEWNPREQERIRSALNAIPARGYDQWVQCGMALHSLDWQTPEGDRGFDLFDAWSASEPELYSLDATEKKWQSFGRSGRLGVGLGTLFHLAEAHGWNGLAPRALIDQEVMQHTNLDSDAGGTRNKTQPHPIFGSSGGAHINGHASAADVLPEALTSPSNESPLILLNQKYACIGDVGGKCLVLGWMPSQVDPAVEIPSFQSFRSFTERYANQYVLVRKVAKSGEESEEPAQTGATWLKWRKRKTFDRIDMVPNAPGVLPGNILNLWRGYAVAPTAGSWARMQEHIATVLSGGNVECLEYIMKWSAWSLQNPGERAEAALVFRGGKGSGKGTFAHAMRRLFGSHGLHIANSKHLVGSFNAHLRNCLLLYADEAFWAGDKQGESTLKALITESTLTIEQKGVDAIQWRNRIHLIMTANAEWVVPASHDERRYAVFNVEESRIGDKAYFEKLYDELNAGGLAAMLHDLLKVDLKGWHPRQIPKTEALAEQKMQSMQPMQEWWESLLQEGTIPAAPKESPDTAYAQYLLNHARDFAPRLKELTPVRLGRFLAGHGCIKLHKASGNAWRFPALGEARAKWTKYYQGWRWERDAGEWAPRS